jgi:nucleoside-diphosphate-sugar epimerase
MSKDIRLLKPAYDIGTGIGNVVEELGKLAGWEGIEVTDGDPCEAQDNTADITELEKLGWKPTIDVEEYLISKTVPN